MDEERVKEIMREMVFWSGKKDMAIDEIAMIQPGLARLMPEIGNRTWKLYYAARARNWPNATYQWKEARKLFEIGARTWKLFYAGKAQNWPLAMYQWKEAKKLFELGMYTRPKHEDAMEEYLNDHWAPLKTAIDHESVDEFMKAMDEAVDAANAWHEKKDKPYIRWRVPDHPPPDLDLEPRR